MKEEVKQLVVQLRKEMEARRLEAWRDAHRDDPWSDGRYNGTSHLCDVIEDIIYRFELDHLQDNDDDHIP